MMFGTFSLLEWLPMLEGQSWIVRCVLCSTLVTIVTWLVVLGSTRKSAAIRHRIFLLGFAGMLIVPVAVTTTVGWNPTIRFADQSKLDAAVDLNRPHSSSELVIPESTGSEAAVVIPSGLESVPKVTSINPANAPLREPEPNDSLVPKSDIEPTSEVVEPVSQARVFFSMPRNVFGTVWALGAVLLAIKLALEWTLTRSIMRNGIPITDEHTVSLLKETRQAMQRFANHRSKRAQVLPRLLCSRSIQVPLAAGVFSRAIILPVGFGKWTNERLRIVLMHELTHLDRHDVLANVLARLACIVYWFNPLVWLAARRMCLEREQACDDFLLSVGESAERYANDLFEIAASLKKHYRAAHLATPMATQTNLKTRIQRLMRTDLDRRFVSTRTSLFTALMAVMSVIMLAVLSPSFGVAQSGRSSATADRNDIAVTLSGELSSDWFDRLKSMPKLQKLTIRNPALKHLKVSQLRELTNLTEFSAEDFSIDSRLADTVAVNIAQLPRLKSVEFHRTGLTGRGLQALSRSSAAELILDCEEVLTDADFKHIAVMPSLSSLVLDSTPIDVEGLTALQAATSLRRLALRRHPAGAYQEGSAARVKVIAGFENLEELELSDTDYSHLVPLKACKSLKLLTLRFCGANNPSNSLKQLTQLKLIEIDNCDIRNESFDDVKSSLAEIGIMFADVSRPAADFVPPSSTSPDEATLLARHALEQLDVGRHFPSFWMKWHHHWSEIPSMTAERTRTVHRLKQALTVESEKQPWEEDTTFAYAPGQFFVSSVSTGPNVQDWQQTTFGDAQRAWSRQGRMGQQSLHVLRNGVLEFEESLGHRFPPQLSVTHQHMWWGTPLQPNSTSSPVPPQNVAYIELPNETFAGDSCRVFQAPGRSERLWVSEENRRLRGSLQYIHQGYFTPFYKQDVVQKIVGRQIESQDEYRKLFSGPGALSEDLQHRLSQAWAEHEFSHAYPGTLIVFDDYREIAPGKWFPFKVTSSGWHHNDENEGRYDFFVTESVVNEVALDRDDLESVWAELLPKTGDNIQDQRNGAAVDYKFDDNRTEDDIQAMVNEQLLTFARSAIQIEIAKSPIEKMIGKPAPGLLSEDWIGDRPEMTGKRYLIHFWATWCGPCKADVPVLNSIAKNQLVIGVHPGDTAIEQVSQSVRDSKMAYPTVVAPHGSEDLMGYPVKAFPYCIEVDEQGNVAKHGFLDEVLGIKVRSNEAANQSPKASGTVLAIEAKDGLAVVSLGEADGIESNQILDVRRDGKTIAQLRVVTLQKNRCVGKSTAGNEQTTLTIGDKVVSFTATPGP